MKNLTIKNELNKINEEFGLVEQNGIILTTSLKVAEIYGKEHKNVISKIRSFIDLIPEINGLNFKLVDYVDLKGEKRPMYHMDRQGFSMLVNKFTGDDATIFTYKYTKAFERMIELIEQLDSENKKLYEIAVSKENQIERQYEADKVKYSVLNIKKVLYDSKYTELEDTINRIINVHTNLKKKDRYKYHSGMSKTEYKQHIVSAIDNKLDEILLTQTDMLYHTVAQQLQKNLKDKYIETKNRSTSQIISGKDRKIEQLQETKDE